MLNFEHENGFVLEDYDYIRLVIYLYLYRGSSMTLVPREARQFQSGMLPFERASKITWLGHISDRNWRPSQNHT